MQSEQESTASSGHLECPTEILLNILNRIFPFILSRQILVLEIKSKFLRKRARRSDAPLSRSSFAAGMGPTGASRRGSGSPATPVPPPPSAVSPNPGEQASTPNHTPAVVNFLDVANRPLVSVGWTHFSDHSS